MFSQMRHDLAHYSIRQSHSSNISSEFAGPVKAKFHRELIVMGGTKIYSNDLGHMTKMAAMPIYDKNPSKIFSETSWLMTFDLGI